MIDKAMEVFVIFTFTLVPLLGALLFFLYMEKKRDLVKRIIEIEIERQGLVEERNRFRDEALSMRPVAATTRIDDERAKIQEAWKKIKFLRLKLEQKKQGLERQRAYKQT